MDEDIGEDIVDQPSGGGGGAELIRPPARNPTIWQNLLTCWQMLARFRLYRRQLFKVNMHVAAFF